MRIMKPQRTSSSRPHGVEANWWSKKNSVRGGGGGGEGGGDQVAIN